MKNILLAVTGGIAAYKALELTRLFVKAGCKVKVVLTASAQAFVTPLSFEALCLSRVYKDLFGYTDDPIEHIELARWADKIVIAPATANTIAKIAHGLANDLLTNVVLATEKPIFIAPAMNKFMWKNGIVQENIKKLKVHNFTVLPPESGTQACGDVGEGRLMAPEKIVVCVLGESVKTIKQKDRKIIITAGPTIEAIDPVRFLSNHSSGKMGYSLASVFADSGWEVILVSGPTQLPDPIQLNINTIQVKNAQQMYDAVHQNCHDADVFIGAAAVADYRAKSYSDQKIKKTTHQNQMTIELVKNIDILKSVSILAENRPFCVGFAAETNDAKANAFRKINSKKLDLLVLNRVNNETGFPFYSDQNCVEIYDQNNELVLQSSLENKGKIAHKIATLVEEKYRK